MKKTETSMPDKSNPKWHIIITRGDEIVYDSGLPFNLTIIRGKVFRIFERHYKDSPLEFVLSVSTGRSPKTKQFYPPANFKCRAWGDVADRIENEIKLNGWVDVLGNYLTPKYHGQYEQYFKVYRILTPHEDGVTMQKMDSENYIGTAELPY